MNKVIRSLSLTLALVAFGGCMVSCRENNTPADVIDANYEWVTGNFNDTSELSDYAGQHKMNLVGWNVTQTGAGKVYESKDDVVSKEIERVTGVSVSKKSYDNAGVTADVKYSQLLATNDLPDFAYGSGWCEPDELWDLTDLIDKYCPTIKARMPASVWNSAQVNGGQKGKVYGIPYGLGNVSLSQVDPEADASKTFMFEFQNDYYPYIVVRDDILTEAYPEAKTADQIDALFAQQGYFTEEDLFDVEITSADQFRNEFLPKLQTVIDNNPRYTMQNGRKVKTMLITEGSDRDNWSFLGVMVPKLLGATATHMNSYFTYWDVDTQKIELMLYQDFYKDEVYEWAKLINEGSKKEDNNQPGVLVSDYGMTTLHSRIQGELNSGYYAIGYMSSMLPQGNVASYTKADGTTETVRYRKVYLKIEKSPKMEFLATGEALPSSVMFFKDQVSEDELPQLLRWLDYQCSRLADKLYAWGPESAGLFNEDANGKRTFKDEELANQMVYSTATLGSLVQKYNLANGTLRTPQPTFPFVNYGQSTAHPKCSYDLSKLTGLAESYFSSSIVCSDKKPVGLAKVPGIQSWTEADLPGVTAIWSKRKQIEDQLKTVLLSGASKSTFDTAYKNMTDAANYAGWTKAYFNGTFTNKFLELNEDYLYQFYKGAM